jgi:protein-S-isoprenylcysteine O-methyltransferase Ste14
MSIISTFVFYFIGFAFLHSLLATDYTKKRAEKILNERFRYYRLIYNIISFITAAPAFGDEYMKYQQRVSMFIPVKWFINRISDAAR